MRPIVLMHQSPDVLSRILLEPSLHQARALGFKVVPNPTDGPLSLEEWARLIGSSQAVLTTWSTPEINGALLDLLPDLRIIGHAAGSVAHIAPEVFDRGVTVCSANPILAGCVAETTLMALLMAVRRAHLKLQFGTRSEPMDWENRKQDIRSLQDLCVGIWGYGNVAQALVPLLRPLSPRRILIHDEYFASLSSKPPGLENVPFDDLFQQADAVICLAGLTEKNRGRLGAAQLEALPDNAILVNVGRAHLIQYEPLLAELGKNRITAFLDVFHEEPPPPDDPLASLPNVILSPHNAGTGRSHMMIPALLEDINRFFRGEPLKYQVTRQHAAAMTKKHLAQ